MTGTLFRSGVLSSDPSDQILHLFPIAYMEDSAKPWNMSNLNVFKTGNNDMVTVRKRSWLLQKKQSLRYGNRKATETLG